MSEHQPLVSVTMPAHRAQATIVESVGTVFAQTVDRWELIIVDDGSPTPVVQTLAAELADPRVRVIRHERNMGLAASRNTALAAARAPLLAHLDADDLWEPEYLEALIPCFEDPAVGLAYPNILTFGLKGDEGLYLEHPERHPMKLPELARDNRVPGINIVRTEAVRSVGGYATHLWGAVDYALYLELAAAGWRFAFVDRVLGHYRWTPSSMSNDWDKVQRDNLMLLWSFVRRHPLEPGPRRRLARLALRELAIRFPGLRAAGRALRQRRRGHT